MSEEQVPPGFLDVTTLLEASEPQPRMPWVRLALGGAVALMIIAAIAGAAQNVELQVIASALAVTLFLVSPSLLRLTLRAFRSEQAAVQGIVELVQLRRWPEAAAGLQHLLSRPMQSGGGRAEALVYLAAVLARYHRFEDAVSVDNYLLENELLSDGAEYGIKLGRAMAMLREDHLFDADGAISDLRRSGPADSAGLALVEIYRHVKTGHPDDAIAIFEKMKTPLRDQLGHRVGDAYALAARGYDLLDRQAEAADTFRRATLISPLVELCRRYPEVSALLGRYEAGAAPPEMA